MFGWLDGLVWFDFGVGVGFGSVWFGLCWFGVVRCGWLVGWSVGWLVGVSRG